MSQTPISTCTLPDGPRFAAFVGLLEPLLMAAAVAEGGVAQALSVALDLPTDAAPGTPLTLDAWVERATRTLVFANAQAKSEDGTVLATASAILKLTR